jgi:prepilin-type processing-associated H-X9-DG protein
MHNYEFAAGSLPPGVIEKTGPIQNVAVGQHVSWTVHLLRFLEQNGIADNFDIPSGTYAPANGPAVAMLIPTLLCPSSSPTTNGAATIGLSHYAGCHNSVEAPIDVDNDGLLFLNSAVTYADIYDGSSNTILVGEFNPEATDLGWASGTRATLRNTGELLPLSEWRSIYGGGATADKAKTWVGGFGGPHPGVTNFLFADGSVRSLQFGIDPALLENLGNREDGAMMGDQAGF